MLVLKSASLHSFLARIVHLYHACAQLCAPLAIKQEHSYSDLLRRDGSSDTPCSASPPPQTCLRSDDNSNTHTIMMRNTRGQLRFQKGSEHKHTVFTTVFLVLNVMLKKKQKLNLNVHYNDLINVPCPFGPSAHHTSLQSLWNNLE